MTLIIEMLILQYSSEAFRTQCSHTEPEMYPGQPRTPCSVVLIILLSVLVNVKEEACVTLTHSQPET